MGDAPKRKPSEMAERFFSLAANAAFPGIQKGGLSPNDHANVLHKLAAGLEQMAIGLRATYMKLDEIEALIKGSGLGTRQK